MRLVGLVVCLGLPLIATPAHACLEIVSERSKARAFNSADVVVKVKAKTEEYLAVPGEGSLRIGVGTGRIVRTLKGSVSVGDTISYRVVDGTGAEPACPSRRFARPGETYTLYLKYLSDWGPPVILLPVD